MNWKFFTFEEFTCKCGCGQNLMHPSFIDKLDLLREDLDFPLVVTSGYRCPKHNNKVSTTGLTGPHTTGRAVDLSVDRARAYKLLDVALALKFTGIGVQQKGAVRFIHLDDLLPGANQPRPTIWSY